MKRSGGYAQFSREENGKNQQKGKRKNEKSPSTQGLSGKTARCFHQGHNKSTVPSEGWEVGGSGGVNP